MFHCFITQGGAFYTWLQYRMVQKLHSSITVPSHLSVIPNVVCKGPRGWGMGVKCEQQAERIEL